MPGYYRAVFAGIGVLACMAIGFAAIGALRLVMPEVMQLAHQIFGPSFASGTTDHSLAGGVAL